jgi:cellulose synthase/poly-beta-1,6-N-acetylglucosamine synthase-like glycosyltransferase
MMGFWIILYIIDGLLFLGAAGTTLYMLVYAVASLFNHHNELPNVNRQNRFIILIPAYKEDAVIESSVKTILSQTYPQRLFDVVVISDHQDEITNFKLAQYPITLLTPDFERSTKAKSLNLAMMNLPEFKIYDIVILLDADNMVDEHFLDNMNRAYELAGTKAIQAHRVSKNRDTNSAILDAIFEEINNSIFRKGHVTLGISSAITGSGIAFDFNWFKKNVGNLKTAGEDKELEVMLMQQHIFVDFFNDIYVYDEKTRGAKDFNKQRGRWMSTQYKSLRANIFQLIPALFTKRYDYADKILQWMILPRTILMALITFMSILLPFIYMTLAIKWWILFAVIMFVFALATPDYLIDKRFDRAFISAPFIMIGSILNTIRNILSNRKFVHLNHKSHQK